MAVVGSLLNAMIEGITYPAAGDVDVSHILSKFENNMIPSSGDAIPQMIKRVAAAESMVLLTDANQAEQLKNFANSTEILNMSFTLADGSSYACQGRIELENRETATGRTTIKMMPVNDWTLFAA
jgi:hypothetical protein